jgi:hypothetical protein
MTGIPATGRSFDPFRALSSEERSRHLRDYKSFLEARDGEPDTEQLRLPHREARFRELDAKPVEWTGDADLDGFYQHLRDTARPEIDMRTVWLVATAKANIGESYGVEIEMRKFTAAPEAARNADRLYLHLMLEEHYHTRILEELCRTCGVQAERRLPSRIQRMVIHFMMYLPERVRWVPILAGEVLGSEVFKLLREGAGVFSAQPEVEERVRSLLEEIWVDEVFHVAYLRAKLGPLGCSAALLLLPLLAWSVMRDVPQLQRLGWTRKTVLDRLRRGIELPPGIDWMPADPV